MTMSIKPLTIPVYKDEYQGPCVPMGEPRKKITYVTMTARECVHKLVPIMKPIGSSRSTYAQAEANAHLKDFPRGTYVSLVTLEENGRGDTIVDGGTSTKYSRACPDVSRFLYFLHHYSGNNSDYDHFVRSHLMDIRRLYSSGTTQEPYDILLDMSRKSPIYHNDVRRLDIHGEDMISYDTSEVHPDAIMSKLIEAGDDYSFTMYADMYLRDPRSSQRFMLSNKKDEYDPIKHVFLSIAEIDKQDTRRKLKVMRKARINILNIMLKSYSADVTHLRRDSTFMRKMKFHPELLKVINDLGDASDEHWITLIDISMLTEFTNYPVRFRVHANRPHYSDLSTMSRFITQYDEQVTHFDKSLAYPNRPTYDSLHDTMLRLLRMDDDNGMIFFKSRKDASLFIVDDSIENTLSAFPDIPQISKSDGIYISNEMMSFLTGEHKHSESLLRKNQYNLIQEYTNLFYRVVENVIREPSEYAPSEVLQVQDFIDSFQFAPMLPRNVWVYHGSRQKFYNDAKAGDVFERKMPMSTSLSYRVSSEFANGKSLLCVRICGHVRAYSTISHVGSTEILSELEIILQPFLTIMVTKVINLPNNTRLLFVDVWATNQKELSSDRGTIITRSVARPRTRTAEEIEHQSGHIPSLNMRMMRMSIKTNDGGRSRSPRRDDRRRRHASPHSSSSSSKRRRY